jgi:hypothetical protein
VRLDTRFRLSIAHVLLDFKIQHNRLILLSRTRKRASHKTGKRDTEKEIKGNIKTTLHAERTSEKNRENIIEPTHEYHVLAETFKVKTFIETVEWIFSYREQMPP